MFLQSCVEPVKVLRSVSKQMRAACMACLHFIGKKNRSKKKKKKTANSTKILFILL